MKKALKETTLFMLIGAVVFLFAACKNQASGDDGSNVVLSGEISINLASATPGTQLTAAITGTQLAATYSGPETGIYYQWKRGEIKVGANSKLFTPDTSGIYTVSVSGNKNGRNSIISNAVSVYAWNGGRPIITSIQTAAPSAHVWAGRLYLYPSTDIYRTNGSNIMDRYHVFSTNNMVDWVDHGEILRRDDLNGNEWKSLDPNAYFMLPPDTAYRTGIPGKGPYFFYFPRALESAGENWTIGAAWSDSPYKGFKNNDVVRLKNNDGSYVLGDEKWIDPCIFQDGGDYYLVTGGSQLYTAKLNDDMVSLSQALTPYGEMPQLPHYNGGPWMFTRNGTYYLMYSGNPSGGNGDELLYAVSRSLSGPWDYQGSILDPVGTGDTSQGSVVEFNGKWYLFYHNAKLSEGKGDLRSVCVDELFFNPNGTIQKVVQTAGGVAKNGPDLNTGELDSLFGAGNYSVEVDYSEIENGNFIQGFVFVKTISAMESSVLVGGGAEKRTNDIPAGAIHDLHTPGSYADFTGVAGNDGGRALIRLGYAIAGSASIQIRVNGSNAGYLSLPDTGGWSVVSQSGFHEINLSPGDNTIRLSGAGVNIASMSIYQER
jgi:hypothetical protein